MDLKHLSYSSINKYLGCPKSWRFQYVQGIRGSNENMRLGTFCHKVLGEHLLKNCTVPMKDCFLEILPEKQESEFPLSSESLAFCNKIFVNPKLIAAMQEVKPVSIEGKFAVEHKMYFDVPGVPLPILCYIDDLTPDNTIVDFKTSGSSWSQAIADKELQASFYASALYASGRVAYSEPVNMRYIVMVKNKTPKIQVFDTVRTFADTTTVYNIVSSVWDSIKKEVFYPNPSTWKCSSKNCFSWNLCEGGKIL